MTITAIATTPSGKLRRISFDSEEALKEKIAQFVATRAHAIALLDSYARAKGIGIQLPISEARAESLNEKVQRLDQILPALEKALSDHREAQQSARLNKIDQTYANGLADVRETLDKAIGGVNRKISDLQSSILTREAGHRNDQHQMILDQGSIRDAQRSLASDMQAYAKRTAQRDLATWERLNSIEAKLSYLLEEFASVPQAAQVWPVTPGGIDKVISTHGPGKPRSKAKGFG